MKICVVFDDVSELMDSMMSDTTKHSKLGKKYSKII